MNDNRFGWAFFVAAALCFSPLTAVAQPVYDLVLKGGHVIDPGNEIDAAMDVAVRDGRIVKVATDIPAEQGKKAVPVEGLYVVPGLIDLHTHVYIHARRSTLYPDDTSLVTGATTVVDAGCSGWRTFDDFKKSIIEPSATRVLAMLNIVGGGMSDNRGAEGDLNDMDPAKTAEKARQHPDIIVGIKTAHYDKPGYEAVKRAVEAGRLADLPAMVDLNIYSKSERDTSTIFLDIMRPGDLHTHGYNDHQVELLNRFSGKVHPYMREARRRGVLLDMGHGGAGFQWPVATKAMKDGFPLDTLGSDLHPNSIMNQVNIPNSISKMMALGMTLPDAVLRATVNPAKAIRRYPELGTLGEGRGADIAVLRQDSGVFAYTDSRRKKLFGAKRVRCVMTIRDGKIVFDEDGLAFPEWTKAGQYEVIE